MAGKQQQPDLNPFGFFFGPLRAAIWLSLTVFGLALLALFLQVASARLAWPDGTGQASLHALASAEAARLGMKANTRAWRFGKRAAEVVYAVEFRATGLHRAVVEKRPLPFLGKLAKAYEADIQVAMTGAWLTGLRLAVATTMLWPVLVLWLAGCLDGLAERATRRACAGRESANLYHRAKYFHFFGLPMAIVVYCVMPIALEPASVVLPLAVLTAWLSKMQWTYYKKYL